MFGIEIWITFVASFIASIWGLIQIGRHFDKEDDPKTKELRKQVGRWLSGQEGSSLEIQLKEINQTFLCLFDHVFSVKQSVVENIIWAGLLLSPVILTALRMSRSLLDNPADALLTTIVLAFSLSLGVAIGRFGAAIAIGRFGIAIGIGRFGIANAIDRFGTAIGIGRFGTAISIGIILTIGLGIGVLSTGLGIVLTIATLIIISLGGDIVLGIVSGLSGYIVLAITSGLSGYIVLAIIMGLSFGIGVGGLMIIGLGSVRHIAISIGLSTIILIGIVIGSTIVTSRGIGVVIETATGIAGAIVFTIGSAIVVGSSRRISVHPLKALASSLVFIIVVSLIASLIREDAVSSLLDTINQQGIKVLAFVALNIFADAISLLETRWVLQRGSSATAVQLLGLLALDLLASTAIFLFLPAIVGEITTFGDAVFLRGDRPWLGILFWSTFGTSVVFYLFVTAVFLFLLPGHVLSKGFRRVIGSFSTIEDRPFTSIAYALIALISMLLALTAGIAAAT
jgi:hypothetical protein